MDKTTSSAAGGAATNAAPTGSAGRATGRWSEAAVRVLRERYLKRDADGNVIETPDELCWRVARAVAEAERQWTADSTAIEEIARRFYTMMADHTFLPNSPTLMNAGKGNNLQLSACYVVPVEDSLVGIFDAVKHAALIHQSGGGCISGDAHVFTTFCGVEAIATLYDRVRAAGQSEEVHDDHAIMDVSDMGIQTMALNPDDGTYEPAHVTHLWRYDVPLGDQIRIRAANGMTVTTSRWHPFMVFDGKQLVERRADELRVGDILPTPNASVRERWPHHEHKEVAGLRLDEEIAWLLGYYLGDGNLGWAKVPESEPRREKLRWRLFDGRTASLERARDILARRFDVHLTITQDARGLYSLATTNAAFIAQFRNLLEVHPGPKDELPFPEMVAKSPLSVVGAFLAGLVDSDGYVDSVRDRVTLTTQSHHLASKVHTLCSLLGLAPGIRSREPHGKGRNLVYEVKLAGEPLVADLRTLIGPYLNDSLKSARLAESRGEHERSTAIRLPIPFSAIKDILQSIGIATKTTAIHKEPTVVGSRSFWLHRWKQGYGAGVENLVPLVAELRSLVSAEHQARLDVLEQLAQGATTVESIETPTEAKPFYDFTVAGHSTYLAGTNGLTAIHNTGFSFSRLRPKGSIVGSTHGVASGPVSFMKIFDGATEAVRQGGTRRGANMGILRVDHPDILEFIDCKRDGSVTNFNISVAITDEFMRALEADGEYDLVDPHTHQATKRLRARDIMDRIIAAAWATGDPGLVFLDRANRSPANPVPEIELLEATNPCFTGDTLVWTSAGPQRFDLLAHPDQSAQVLTETLDGQLVWRTMAAIRKTREGAPVFRVVLRSHVEFQGSQTGATSAFRATGDHKIWLTDGSAKVVSELLPGDRLASAYRLSTGQLAHSSSLPLSSGATHSAAAAPINHEVVRVEYAGEEDVYCGSVEETHRFFIATEHDNSDPLGGVLVANCGEQYLGPYDACNLGSINLGLLVQRDAAGKVVEVDWAALEETTRLCTRFLDDVIDINPYPLPEVREKVHANRRIGLGAMGWAELLFELGLRYDSPEATTLGERVMTAIRDWSRDESERLAEARGPFSNWERSIYKHDKPARNATRTTVAPTGSISILAECSSGIEPIFALAFQHRVKQPDGSYRVLDFVNPFFERALAASDIEDKEAVLAYIKEHGSLHGLYAAEHPALRPYVTAHEIAPEWHIRMQAAFQKGVENSISKTINLANSATYDDVRDAYMLAWELGCLGITIFRDGCKGEQVLNLGVKDASKDVGKDAPPQAQAEAATAHEAHAVEATTGGAMMVAEEHETPTPAARYQRGVKERPQVVTGYTRQVRAPEGKVNVTLNADTDGLLEVFVNVGKAGSDVAALAEALGRLMSLTLQLDSSLSQDDRAREIARQLRSIGGSNSIGFGPERVRSLPDAVARAIECHFSEGFAARIEPLARPRAINGASGNGTKDTNGAGSHNPAINPLNMEHYAVTGNLCPHCGNNTMRYEEGCRKCVSCGHSEC